MLARTQVTLTPEQHRRARARAAEQGISLAEYLRNLVEADLRGANRRVDVTAVFDLGESAGSDVALRKDDYLGEAVATE